MHVHKLPVPGILAQSKNGGEEGVYRNQNVCLEETLTTTDIEDV